MQIPDCFYAADKNNNNYCAAAPTLKIHKGKLTKYNGFCIKNECIVTMELDLAKRKLIFYVDDKCVGPAFKSIKCGKNLYYKVAIVCPYSESSVQIMGYEISNVQSISSK